MYRWLPVVLVLASCAPKTAATPSPATSAETPPAETQPAASAPVLNLPPPAHDSDTVVQMHAWLQSAETARTHLTHGDLESAKEAAAAMAASPSPDGIPPGWRPFAADLLVEATALAAAQNAQEAGGHLGQMALACGTCHTEAGVLEQVKLAALPQEMYDEDVRMDNHQWGSDWMWFGLVTNSADAYRLGAAVFTSENLPAPTQVVSGTDLMPLLGEVAAVAARAAAAEDDEQRAAHYGELLASCAACHSVQMTE